MPKFNTNSQNQLLTCHPELQLLFQEVIKYFDCTVLEGFRNEAKQNKAKDSGNSTFKWPDSKHNKIPSMAVDVVPYPIEWDNIKRMYFFGGYVLGIAQMLKNQGKMDFNVRYGGDWNGNKNINDQTFNDVVHFELIF